MQLKNSKSSVKPDGLNGTPVTKPFIHSTQCLAFFKRNDTSLTRECSLELR